MSRIFTVVELWLDHNGLTRLPEEISQLHSLACLDVSENKLELLPDDLSGMWAKSRDKNLEAPTLLGMCLRG